MLAPCASEDIIDADINENGLITATAEHWYQVSGKHPWTDETMQRTSPKQIPPRKLDLPNHKTPQAS